MSSISIDQTRAGAKRAARTGRARTHDGPEPWIRRDVVGVAIVLAIAVIGLVLGWLGVSDSVDLNEQTRWLGFGIGALMVGGFGMVFWLLLGLRAVAVLRREVMTEVNRRHPEPAKRKTTDVTDRQGYGVASGMKRYHAPGCQMLDGKAVTFADEATHTSAGLTPCPICVGAHA